MYSLVKVLENVNDSEFYGDVDANVFEALLDGIYILGACPKFTKSITLFVNHFKDKLFYDTNSGKYDQFVEKLVIASDTINQNASILNKKLEVLGNQTDCVYNSWKEFDDQLSKGIIDRNISTPSYPSIESSNNEGFVELSKDVINVINNYDSLIRENYNSVLNHHTLYDVAKLASEILPRLVNLRDRGMSAMKQLLFDLQSPLSYQTRWMPLAANIVENFINALDEFVYSFEAPLRKFVHLREILVEIGPYFKGMVFGSNSYEDVILYYESARLNYRSNVDMLTILHKSIDENQNKTINAISQNIASIKDFSIKLSEQIDLTVVTN